MMAGWKASVNGKAVTIKTVRPRCLPEGVKVAPGAPQTVTYSFLPPHEKVRHSSRLARGASSWWFVWVYERRNLMRGGKNRTFP